MRFDCINRKYTYYRSGTWCCNVGMLWCWDVGLLGCCKYYYSPILLSWIVVYLDLTFRFTCLVCVFRSVALLHIYVYVYICVYMYIRVCVYMCLYVCVCICKSMHVFVYICCWHLVFSSDNVHLSCINYANTNNIFFPGYVLWEPGNCFHSRVDTLSPLQCNLK